MFNSVDHGCKRMLVIIIAVCFVFMAFPMTTFAATVKRPTRVNIVSIKATEANTYNKSTVSVKWEKIKKNITNYQIYKKVGSGKWKLAKTVKNRISSAKIKVDGGKKYQFKVRAMNKKKVGSKYKTKYGRFSKTKSLFIKESTAISDSGSYEYDFIDIETNNEDKTISFKFEFTNLNNYEKNPSNYFKIKAIQDGKELTLKSGSISVNVPGLTKVKVPLVFTFDSENPILLQGIDLEYNDIGIECVIPID